MPFSLLIKALVRVVFIHKRDQQLFIRNYSSDKLVTAHMRLHRGDNCSDPEMCISVDISPHTDPFTVITYPGNDPLV